MSQPTAAVRQLAERLLTCELKGAGGAQPEAAALALGGQRAIQRLAQPLGRLIGTEGYWGLLRRAVHLAKNESPLLQELPMAEPASGTDGLDAALRNADPILARQALTAALAHLLWLLVTFIGDDLTRRTLHDAWPELERDGPLSSKEPTT